MPTMNIVLLVCAIILELVAVILIYKKKKIASIECMGISAIAMIIICIFNWPFCPPFDGKEAFEKVNRQVRIRHIALAMELYKAEIGEYPLTLSALFNETPPFLCLEDLQDSYGQQIKIDKSYFYIKPREIPVEEDNTFLFCERKATKNNEKGRYVVYMGGKTMWLNSRP